eukprot:gene22240-23326_t
MPLSIESSSFPTLAAETPSIGFYADVTGKPVFGNTMLRDLEGLGDVTNLGIASLLAAHHDDRDAGEATKRQSRGAVAAAGAVGRIDIRLENGSANDLLRPHDLNELASVAVAMWDCGTGMRPVLPETPTMTRVEVRGHPGGRILLVEEEAPVRPRVTAQLTEIGYRVVQATSATA